MSKFERNKIKGDVPEDIITRVKEDMEVYNLSLADAFQEAVRALCHDTNSELYKAWYYDDFRAFIPSEYRSDRLDFEKYPLTYNKPQKASGIIAELIKKKDEETIQSLFTIETCPSCSNEEVVFVIGVTKCPDCGKPIVPCSLCDVCSYNSCPYGCDGTDNDENIKVTQPEITKKEMANLYVFL